VTEFAMLAIMLGTLWYFFIKPQVEERQRHKDLMERLEKGIRVVTTGGLIGTVVSTQDDIVTLRIADRVNVQVKSSAIAEELE